MTRPITNLVLYGPLGMLYIASLLAASSGFLSHVAWHIGETVYAPTTTGNSMPVWPEAPAWLEWMRDHDHWTTWAVLVALVAPIFLAIWLGLVSTLNVSPTTPRRGLRIFTWTWMISSVGWWILMMWSPT